jgi:hypothetical protein
MYTQTRSVEWLLAGLMIAWGIGLMLPGNTMDLEQFRYLGALAPEPVWAAWSISIGGLRLVALYINGSYYRTPLIRATCSVLGIIWWMVLGYLLQIGTDSMIAMPAGIMWYPVFVGFEGYSAYRGARDAYHSGAIRRWRPQPGH